MSNRFGWQLIPCDKPQALCRMLPAAYHWQTNATSAFLRFNYSTVAYIKPEGARYRVLIQWRGREVSGSAYSVGQGVRHVSRWVSARNELPSVRKR